MLTQPAQKNGLLLDFKSAACSAGGICCAVLSSLAQFLGMSCRQNGEQLAWPQPTGWTPLFQMSENGVMSPGVQDLIIHHALACRLILVYDYLLS